MILKFVKHKFDLSLDNFSCSIILYILLNTPDQFEEEFLMVDVDIRKSLPAFRSCGYEQLCLHGLPSDKSVLRG